VALTANQRQEIISELTENCDTWKGQGDDQTLNKLTDDKLQTLLRGHQIEQQKEAVANTAIRGFVDLKGNAYRFNPEAARWEFKPVRNASGGLSTGVGYGDKTGDGDYEEGPGDDAGDEQQSFMDGKEGESEPDEDDQPFGGLKAKGKGLAQNRRRPMSADEWLRRAPAEVQNSFRIAQQIENQEKGKIIDQLLINVGESDKPRHRERLSHRSLDDLKYDLSLVPQNMPAPEPARQTNNQTKVHNNGFRQAMNTEEDMLTMPTINWSEKGAQIEERGEFAAVSNGGMSQEDEDEWMRSAPAHVRQKLMTANAIESRERKKLIDQITANVTDEAHEQRLISRLQNKSIEELKDYLILAPQKQPANYWGSAAPIANANSGRSTTTVDSDDVLITPTINWEEVSKENHGKVTQ
jgi:hypothetical protein